MTESVELSQCGESPELEKIKKKVFGRTFKFPNISSMEQLEPYEKEKNVYTFMGLREELGKEHIIE